MRTAVRAFAYGDADPSTVLTRTNEVVARQLPDDKFVTLIYGVIDTSKPLGYPASASSFFAASTS